MSSAPELDHLEVVDLDTLEQSLAELTARYREATPFPHVVLDDFLTPEAAAKAMAEFPSGVDDNWLSFSHVNERKFSQTDPTTWGATLRAVLQVLNSQRFVDFLVELTGIQGLFADPMLEGGGLHQSARGGFLNIHADYTVHPQHQDWQRRVNLLLYLNEDWRPEYGGDLELWAKDMSRCERSVAPVGNRVVIFTTDMDSFHGHPEPTTCPAETSRRSLALYYFTHEQHPVVRSTEYRPRPGDGVRSALIVADKYVLRAFDWSKRHLGVSDKSAAKVLSRIERIRRRGSQG